MSPTAQDVLAALDLRDPRAVVAAFDRAADANHHAACRVGSVDAVEPRGTLLATGDLHDNPVHFARVLDLARLHEHTPDSPRHLTFHEIIHGERRYQGMDLSHRALARVAALKAAFPESVHTLLANHELAQIVGAGVIKDGVNNVAAFNEGLDYAFGDDAAPVRSAIERFVRSMALALVSGRGTDAGLLCAHSLPGPDLFDRFDPAVLDRALTPDDLAPRRGSAHIMVWGRRWDAAELARLSHAWGVRLFVLGHEKAEHGWLAVEPNAVVLNSDHERGAVLDVALDTPPKWSSRDEDWPLVRFAEP